MIGIEDPPALLVELDRLLTQVEQVLEHERETPNFLREQVIEACSAAGVTGVAKRVAKWNARSVRVALSSDSTPVQLIDSIFDAQARVLVALRGPLEDDDDEPTNEEISAEVIAV